MKVETIYRAVISEDAFMSWVSKHGMQTAQAMVASGQTEPVFEFLGEHFTPQTRDVLMWILDQLPATNIDLEPQLWPSRHTRHLVATFANDVDATAFKVRWG